MPPWTARLLNSSGTNANQVHGDNSTHHTVIRPTPPPHPAIAPLHPPTLHPPQPVDDLSRSPSKRHGRSISHPFPSLFGGSRKVDRKGSVRQEQLGLDSTDDESASSSAGQSASPQKAIPRNGFAAGKEEPMKGKCMTCDSTVRWPKGLKVFRCTICLTINDLEAPHEAPNITTVPPKNDSYPALNVHRKRECLSIR